MLAIQGPQARAKTAELVSCCARAALIQRTQAVQGLPNGDWFIARTGYTGEDGLEIMLPAARRPRAFLSRAGRCRDCPDRPRRTRHPAPGSRHEPVWTGYDEEISPLAANMAWTIAWEPAERDFVGRSALEAQQSPPA
jgi:aminomethyltransferase